MKKNLTIGLLVLNLSAAAALASDEPKTLREDCVEQVKGMVLLAGGLLPGELDKGTVESEGKDIVISDIRVLKETPTAGAPAILASAKVSGAGYQGTVRVNATRGGCFVVKANLAESKQ